MRAAAPDAPNRWHDGFMAKSPPGFSLAIEYFREEDGRWLADIAALPGVTAYGRTRKQATAAVQALAALLRIGWTIKRQSGTSHRILARPGWSDVLFAYHDRVTLGPTAMKVLAKKTGLKPGDL